MLKRISRHHLLIKQHLVLRLNVAYPALHIHHLYLLGLFLPNCCPHPRPPLPYGSAAAARPGGRGEADSAPPTSRCRYGANDRVRLHRGSNGPRPATPGRLEARGCCRGPPAAVTALNRFPQGRGTGRARGPREGPSPRRPAEGSPAPTGPRRPPRLPSPAPPGLSPPRHRETQRSPRSRTGGNGRQACVCVGVRGLRCEGSPLFFLLPNPLFPGPGRVASAPPRSRPPRSY